MTMKSPDEIKKGLECCRTNICGGSKLCSYWKQYRCMNFLHADALALIQQLTEEGEAAIRRANVLMERVQQCEVERDELKEALGLMVYQYCVRGDKLDHMYMCAGETAFRVLGLEQYGNTSSLESWLFPECQDKEE